MDDQMDGNLELVKNAVKFTHEREHAEGGFTLYQNNPDTKNTYYGVKILRLFNEEPYNKKNTIEWIKSLQKNRLFAIQGLFYRINILKYFKRKIFLPELNKLELSSISNFKTIEIAYFYLVVSKLLGLDNLTKIKKWMLKYQNADGGFGVHRSDVESTCYAIQSINYLEPSSIPRKNSVIDFIDYCQTSNGGFSFIPEIYPPYLEPTYSAVKTLNILHRKPDMQDEIINFVRNLQNKDGGFRRSKYIGISELEYTFKALNVLKCLKYL
ncbi:MAG: prenyltransferase/squalene oxidase repeat-containing protein [Methanothermobacter sp.]